MIPETLVLDRDYRVDEIFGYVVVFYPDAVLRAVEPLILKLDQLADAVFAVGEVHVINLGRLIGVLYAEQREVDLGVDVVLDINREHCTDYYAGDKANEHYGQDYIE